MNNLIVATRNVGKYKEIAEMLPTNGITFRSVLEFDVDDPEETGETYYENAALKAQYAADKTGFPAIADDSGMEIRALDGYPGVYSARCAGKNVNDNTKIQHILHKMNGVEDRYAEFVCVIALAFPEKPKSVVFFEGRCAGVLANEIRGEVKNGVQYDAIFIVPEYDRTFGELSQDIKNDISHRAEACRKMRSYLGMV